METKFYSSLAIQLYRRVNEYREVNCGYKMYHFDAVQTALIRQLLELVDSGEYEKIPEVIDDYYAIPF